MNRKKILALSVIFIFFAVLSSGCFDRENKEAETVKSDVSVKTEDLVWYIPGDEPIDLPSVLDKASQYLEKKISIVLHLCLIPKDQYTNQMSILIRSGENFDICFTSDTLNSYKKNVFKGAFLRLDSLLEKYGGSLKETVDSRLWEGVTVNGGIYGVPANREIAVSFVWLPNKELVDKDSLKLSEFSTLKSLESVLSRVAEEEPDYTPLALTDYGLPGLFSEFDMVAGENIPVGVSLQDAGSLKAVNVLKAGSITTELQILEDFYEKGYINQNAAKTDILPENRFLTTEIGGAYAEKDWSTAYGYEVLSIPRTSPVITAISASEAISAVSVTSAHPEKAVELLALVNTDSYLRNLLQYGLENVHFSLTGGTTVSLLAKSSDYFVPFSVLGNDFITYTVFPEPFDKWEEIKKYNESALSSPLLGFCFNPEKVSAQLAAVEEVTAKYRPLLFTGAGDYESLYPQMLEDYQNAGLEEILEEVQLQIDAWKKK